MPLRLQEIHPSVVHLPLTLLPAAVLADAVGVACDDAELLRLGKWTMALAAGTALVTGLTGLVAQEEVKTDEPAHAMLVTHRNLNVGLTVAATGMAAFRARRARPGLAYLIAGAGAVGLLYYSAYLGGHMVYARGVGVEPSGGLREDTPAVERGGAFSALGRSLRDVLSGLRHAAGDLRQREVAPWMRREVRGEAARR